MIVCSKKQLREAYAYVKKMEREIENKKKEIQVLEALIRASKDAIRNTRKEKDRADQVYPKWRPYNGNWDSRYFREEYEGVFTPEECEEYKEENWEHWYNPWGDGRDCTGVWFTRYIDVFPLPQCNKTVIYHIQDRDV